MVVERNSTYQ